MSKVKIVTTKDNRLGKQLVSSAGTITVSQDGIAEVDAEVAEHFVNNGLGWAYASEPSAKKEAKAAKKESAKEETPVVSSDANGGGTEDVSDDDIAKTIGSMSKMADLRSLAKDAGLPSNEWGSIKSKKEMKEYLLSKMDD